MGRYVKTEKVERAFYKSVDFQRIVRVGAAAFEPRLTGGFERLINQQQGAWKPNSKQYAEWKQRKGLDRRVWVRTGETLKAMNSGKPAGEGTAHGVRYKVTPGRFLAVLRVLRFGTKVEGVEYGKKGGRKRNKMPTRGVQKKIYKNLNYGIDVARKAQKEGKAVKSKSGKVLSGFPARRLFWWQSGEIQEIRESIEKEVKAIMQEVGFDA